MNRGFLRAGHLPTLVAAFLYFDVSFMVWVILGPLAVFIARDLHLSAAEKGLMVATPVLAGAVLRIVTGALADHLKPRLTAIIMQTIVIAGLAGFWAFGVASFEMTLALGVVLGVAGASFAVALPLASYWYPPQHQGTALGIAGAGNSGTVLAALFAPSLAVALGWRNVLGLAIVPLAVVLALFVLLAKNSPLSPARKSLKDYAEILGFADAWWLMAFYCVTFGGFVGLSSFLPIYFNDQYGLSPVAAGYCTAASVFAGSFVRPLGGAVADRIGGVKALSFVYGLVAVLLLIVSRGIAEPDGRAAADHRDDGRARRGQRGGVPDRPTALCPQRRSRHRSRRRDRRDRRVLSRRQSRLRQAAHRRLRDRARDLRLPRARGADRAHRRRRPLAQDLARPLGARHSQRLIPPVAGLEPAALRACLPRAPRATYRNPLHATRSKGSLCGRRDAQTATTPRHRRQRHVAGPRAGKTVRSRSRSLRGHDLQRRAARQL